MVRDLPSVAIQMHDRESANRDRLNLVYLAHRHATRSAEFACGATGHRRELRSDLFYRLQILLDRRDAADLPDRHRGLSLYYSIHIDEHRLLSDCESFVD